MINKPNNYDSIASDYLKTSFKPDKQFSMLPTMLKMAGNLTNKTVIDLGCGSGFYTREFAKPGARKVIGIDNSEGQINLAKSVPSENTLYINSDIFLDEIPDGDVIAAPYVLNYAQNTEQLKNLILKIYNALSDGGRFLTIIDIPTGKDLRKFGAVKTLLGPAENGTNIQIDLFDEEKFICSLNAIFFLPSTLEIILHEAGFKKITWHKPVISPEGIEKYDRDYWDGYIDNPELGYLSAEK